LFQTSSENTERDNFLRRGHLCWRCEKKIRRFRFAKNSKSCAPLTPTGVTEEKLRKTALETGKAFKVRHVLGFETDKKERKLYTGRVERKEESLQRNKTCAGKNMFLVFYLKGA